MIVVQIVANTTQDKSLGPFDFFFTCTFLFLGLGHFFLVIGQLIRTDW